MAKTRALKEQHAQAVHDCLVKANSTIVADYKGLTAEELRDLRAKLRAVDSEFTVVKNRVVSRALDDSNAGLKELLAGPVGIAFAYKDPAAVAKQLIAYEKAHDKIKIKGGIIDGDTVDSDKVKVLANLPSKDVLLGQMLSTLIAPHRGIMYTLKGVVTNLVRVIDVISKKQNNN